MALNPSKILYDMDSEDEQWISKNGKTLQSQETCCIVITDGIFEKCMDMLEKFAYAQQRNHFTVTELEILMVGVVPSEVIIAIYHHWQQKRKRTGIPLIRHLQPPSWERYHVKLQEWNRLTTEGKSIAECGDKVKAPNVEKPVMFAFCLKPRGLKVPKNGSKCRSQKKLHDSGHRHANIGEQGGVHTSVREEMASNHRPGKRNRVQQQDMEFPDWPSKKRHLSDFYPGRRNVSVQDYYELRMREASGAAKRASCIAVLKREKAERLCSKADFAIGAAASALMVASAMKASYYRTN
ncbi:uncharacterized protein LOC141672037 [Apium graveolens]|uniref:uncharacterized protein LOC141672037 n=1 Tax=Apium graveolens TaxID=4045 RepID=UPI003D7BFE95